MSNSSETCDITNALTFQELMDMVDSTLQPSPSFRSDLPWDWNYVPTALDPAFDSWALSTSELETPLAPEHEVFDAQHYHDDAQDTGWPLLVSSFPDVPDPSSSSVPAQMQDPPRAPGTRRDHYYLASATPVLSQVPEISLTPSQPPDEDLENSSSVLQDPIQDQSLRLPHYTERIESTSDRDGEGSEYDFSAAAGPAGVATDWTPLLSPWPRPVPALRSPGFAATSIPGGRQGKPPRKSKSARQGKPYNSEKRKRVQSAGTTAKGASDPLIQRFRDELQLLLTAGLLIPPGPYYKAHRVLEYDDPLCENHYAARDAQLRAKMSPQRAQCLFLSPTDFTFGRCQSQAKNMRQHRLDCHPVYECHDETGEGRWAYNLGTIRGTRVKGANLERFTSRAPTKDEAEIVAKDRKIADTKGWKLTPLGGGRMSAASKVLLDDERAGLSR